MFDLFCFYGNIFMTSPPFLPSILRQAQDEEAVLFAVDKHFIFHFYIISLINNNSTALLLSKHLKIFILPISIHSIPF